MLLATAARAEPRRDQILPVQVDFDLQVLGGEQALTFGLHFGAAYARMLTHGDGWQMFGGIGITDTVATYWKRKSAPAADAISGMHAPGLEARLGFIHGTQLGAPRFVLKVAPMWARGTTNMGVPGDRGLGFRTSVGLTWPGWLLGRIEPDPPDAKSYERDAMLEYAFSIFAPSEVEFVFQHTPGDNWLGIAVGWSL